MSQTTMLGLPREQVLTSPIDIRARSHDASHFLLCPRAVVVPRDAADVARLLRACAEVGAGVTFRSGGTSLSGQAGTDAVLADVRRHFDAIEILGSGERVRVQPGVTVDRLNAHLAPYGRVFGPDPASSAACTIGGVVANNSSGMACGTMGNSYRTLESMVVVLASGTVIDTGARDADEKLRALEPALHQGLLALRERLASNPASVATIEQQFSMKNTMGYGLNSFLDHSTPSEILAHLMVGSEGTLGFVASAVFRTMPVRPYACTGLLVFDDLHTANRALPDLVATGAATLELMDTASIKVGQALPGCPARISAIRPASQAALLVEYQATSEDEVEGLVSRAQPVLSSLPVDGPVSLTGDPRAREELWAMRKGLYTSVAAARRPGTTALLEDVVVPVEALADACVELAGLFDEYSYPDSVIFGHAKDGNIHFMITDEFDRQLERYARFTDAMVDLVLGHHGSLKAEHGTGRVMAPFVRKQYGDELYEVMREVKRLFDPWNLLNDGVVITDDPEAHLKHIKTPVAVDPMVDACVECGYCEPVCPARALTLTPRQRIVVQREIGLARARGEEHLAKQLEQAYVYDGIQTCAVDGMCVTACPVGINTGLYVKRRRAEAASPAAQAGWKLAATHWAGATHVASFALSTAQSLTPVAPLVTAANQIGRSVIGDDVLPLWSPDLPGGGRSRRRPRPNREPVAVYLPACVNSMFGPALSSSSARPALSSSARPALSSSSARPALSSCRPASSSCRPASSSCRRQDPRQVPEDPTTGQEWISPQTPAGDPAFGRMTTWAGGMTTWAGRMTVEPGPEEGGGPAFGRMTTWAGGMTTRDGRMTGRAGRMTYADVHGGGVQAAFEALCAWAGLALVVPDSIDSLCCATPWTSKGMTRGRDAMASIVIPAVRKASDDGRLPIVCDASSCTEGLQRMLAAEEDLRVVDCVQFVAERILPLLSPGGPEEPSPVAEGSATGDGSSVSPSQLGNPSDFSQMGNHPRLKPKLSSITLHPTCSSTQIGLNPYLVAIAHAVADKVNVPIDAGCCAFAGDRGMLHPELTRAATRPEAAEAAMLDAEVHASCNRTCEIGMTRATGEPYRHILEVLADQVIPS